MKKLISLSLLAFIASLFVIAATPDASNKGDWYFAGNVGIGDTPVSSAKLFAQGGTTDGDCGILSYGGAVSSGEACGIKTLSQLGSATDQYGIFAGAANGTNNYAVYATAGTGTNNYCFYGAAGDAYFADNVGIGTASPAAKIDILMNGGGSPDSARGVGLKIKDGAYNSDNMLEMYDNDDNARFIIDSSGNVGIGRAPTAGVSVDLYRASGANYFWTDSDSLAAAEVAGLNAVGKKSGGTDRAAQFGVIYYNQSAGGLNQGGSDESVGFFYLTAGDGVTSYVWPDNGDLLRISTTANHRGGSTVGTVIGDQTSDIRLKKDYKPITDGLAEILQLEPIEFKYKGGRINEKRLGFSAQQVQPILPEVVYNTKDFIETEDGDDIEIEKEEKDKDGNITKAKIVKKGKRNKLAMRYAEIVPVLVKAIQEQQAQIEALKLRVEQLENKE